MRKGKVMKPCAVCDGDGYTEKFNNDQSDVVVVLCSSCNGTGVENAGIEI